MKKILVSLPLFVLLVLVGFGCASVNNDVVQNVDVQDPESPEVVEEGQVVSADVQMYSVGGLEVILPVDFETSNADAGRGSVHMFEDSEGVQKITISYLSSTNEGGTTSLLYTEWLEQKGYSLGGDQLTIGGYTFENVVFDEGSEQLESLESVYQNPVVYTANAQYNEVPLALHVTMSSPITDTMQEILDSVVFFAE